MLTVIPIKFYLSLTLPHFCKETAFSHITLGDYGMVSACTHTYFYAYVCIGRSADYNKPSLTFQRFPEVKITKFT